jgi:hypothetical protein
MIEQVSGQSWGHAPITVVRVMRSLSSGELILECRLREPAALGVIKTGGLFFRF